MFKAQELIGCQMVLWGESWLDKGTETVPAASPTLVCSPAKAVHKEILLFAEALEEEGINIKVKEKSKQDLNKKLWKGGCSFAALQKGHGPEDATKHLVTTLPCPAGTFFPR